MTTFIVIISIFWIVCMAFVYVMYSSWEDLDG